MQTTQPVRERSRNIIRNPRVRDHIFSSWVDSSNTPRLLREFLVSVCPGEYSHITLPWSTSPVEGHINRLKMLKRQMFGRENQGQTRMALPETHAACVNRARLAVVA